MSPDVTIRLPPEGTTARSLVIDFIAKLKTRPTFQVSIEVLEDRAVLSGSEDEIVELVNGVVRGVGGELKNKVKSLRDIPVHRNDMKMLSKLLRREVGKGSRFSETVSMILTGTTLTYSDMLEWSEVRVEGRAKEANVVYGSTKELPLPQPVLTERFESGYEFMHGIGGRSIKYRGSRPWLTLILSGYAISYAGNIDGIIHYMHVPEEFLREPREASELSALVDELIPKLELLNVPAEPKTAYILYVASQIALSEDQKLLKALLDMGEIPLEIERVRYEVNAYTTVERFSSDLHSILSKILELENYAISWIRDCASKCLHARRRTQEYALYADLTTRLYNTLSGAEDPIDTLYYALRVVVEKEARSLESKGKHEAAKRLVESGRIAVRNLYQKLAERAR